MQLGLALAALGVTTSLVAHIYALNPYAFLSRDYAQKQHYIHITNTLQVS
jgi:hypothetical protein